MRDFGKQEMDVHCSARAHTRGERGKKFLPPIGYKNRNNKIKIN